MKFKTRGAAKTLSLDTSTWPPKGLGRSPDEAGRPRTATLDKPVVLDIALLGHLDMTTLTRRGLLNMCRFRNKGVVGVVAEPTPLRQTSRASSRSDVSGDEATPVTRRRRGGSTSGKKAVIEEEEDEETSWAEDDRFGTYRVRRNSRLNRTFRIPALSRGKRQPLNNIVLNNNNINSNESASPAADLKGGARGRRAAAGPGLDDILGAREQVPEPCRTCGRPELPERLHSHPKLPGKATAHHGYGHLPAAHQHPQPKGPPPPDLPVKNSVKKPVPIKYRPRRGSEGAGGGGGGASPARPAASPARRMASPAKASPAKGAFLVTHFVDADGPASPARAAAARGPRVVTCYVCGREFGTASLPLHEPQCVQRWRLQNTKLPPQWQRQLPDKPVGPITIEDWNKFAWESSKRADSVQCPNCLRRFCPDRINSHERVCFKKQPAVAGSRVVPQEPQAQTDPMAGRGSPLVECYLCGKKFGTRSIGIHEPQCLKKWQALQQHAGLDHALAAPPDSRQLEGPPACKPLAIEFPPKAPATSAPAPAVATPGRKDHPRTTPSAAEPHKHGVPQQAKSAWAGEDGVAVAAAPGAGTPAPAPDPRPSKPPSAAAPSTGRPLHCYLCGQMFGLQSLSIHEPQCLQKWRAENAKLPPHLQRPEPEKPEIIFTDTGMVDRDATAEAAWQVHLSQLVPCTHCGRKFSPERIEVHERCCKGSDR
ncbi:hypothetical protein ONE63_005321 [Megalurothrips usitatus]|uniref:C2HC/C3H-type domain-containing protein n=1 Tax=Megalurothrips usitatus TaxID=439358 RepID=A0AAV7Y1A0_9NEOP|nr:hypothetical protein ONE63_005321 [Megalurothrips usitatus]